MIKWVFRVSRSPCWTAETPPITRISPQVQIETWTSQIHHWLEFDARHTLTLGSDVYRDGSAWKLKRKRMLKEGNAPLNQNGFNRVPKQRTALPSIITADTIITSAMISIPLLGRVLLPLRVWKRAPLGSTRNRAWGRVNWKMGVSCGSSPGDRQADNW